MYFDGLSSRRPTQPFSYLSVNNSIGLSKIFLVDKQVRSVSIFIMSYLIFFKPFIIQLKHKMANHPSLWINDGSWGDQPVGKITEPPSSAQFHSADTAASLRMG